MMMMVDVFRRFSADELKLLRVAMASMFDMILVCAKTLMEFGEVHELAQLESGSV